jgi:hypothetical protein
VLNINGAKNNENKLKNKINKEGRRSMNVMVKKY